MAVDRNTTVESPVEQLLTAKQLGEILGLGRSKVYQMMSAGMLPPSIVLTRARRWRSSVVQRWIEFGCCSLERYLLLTGNNR
jgi:predicted DNA-binding transcriptional regulator AlpA